MSRIVDSSFLITLFDHRDPRREQALTQVEDPTPLLIPPEVMSETLGVMKARRGFDVSEAIWEDVGQLPQVVHLNTTHQEDVAPIFLESEGRLSWTDAAVVAHCLREEAEPLCYDDDIVQAWRSRLDPPARA